MTVEHLHAVAAQLAREVAWEQASVLNIGNGIWVVQALSAHLAGRSTIFVVLGDAAHLDARLHRLDIVPCLAHVHEDSLIDNAVTAEQQA